MDPRPRSPGILLAPPPSGSAAALRFPSSREPPAVDEHLVRPETREEMVRGRRLLAMPALPPHGDQHHRLSYVIGAHVKPGYVGSTDLLTRVADCSNFATDTCVRKEGVDARSGERFLEELSFEVVSEQSLQDITERAEDLTARGVRRVVAIFVKKGEVSEWSPRKRGWQKLDPEGSLVDPTLARPVEVKALLDAAEASNAVARALLAQRNPVLVESENRLREEGERKLREEREKGERAVRETIESLCKAFGIELDGARRARMHELDAAGLAALHGRILAERRWP